MDDRRGSEEPAGIPGPADQPTTPVSSALPEEARLEPTPLHDDGTLVPDQLHDAPEFVPAPIGMLSGAIVPPVDPHEVATSAWITTAAPRRGRSLVSILVTIGAIAIGLAVLGVLVGMNLGLFSNRGQIIFGTRAGDGVCSVRDQTTSITARDTVFYAAHLRNSAGPNETLSRQITRDGQLVSTDEIPPNGTRFDCLGLSEPLGPLEPGVYLFEILRAGTVEASGTLTVT
jgi:hypothetical protein